MTAPRSTIDPMFGVAAALPVGRLSLAALLSLVAHLVVLVGLATIATPGRFGLPIVPDPPGAIIVARLAPMPNTEPTVAPPPIIVAAPPPPPPPPVGTVVAALSAPAVRGALQSQPPRPSAEGVDVTVRTLFDSDKLPLDLASGLGTEYPARPGRFPGPNRILALRYPETAIRDGHSGKVHVLLHLDATGAVISSLFDPEDSEFAPTVRDGLAELRFIPAQLGGAPIAYWIAFEITFSIAPRALR